MIIKNAINLINLCISKIREENEYEGQGMVEYGLILALVSVVAIIGLILIGDNVLDVFNSVGGDLAGTGDDGDE